MPPPPQIPTSNATSSPRHKDLGPIVGGVVGGLGLIAVAVLLCYWMIQRPCNVESIRVPPAKCKRDPPPETKLPGPGRIEPFTLMSPSSVQSYNERYNSLPTSQRRRSPSPMSIIFISAETNHRTIPSDSVESIAPPPSYRHHSSVDSTKAERISQRWEQESRLLRNNKTDLLCAFGHT